ncbi:hypothetical protein BYT27DRAFT_7236154 [Phlegmacium glaucopus]|nr:hypothetical protein BYT27DRAFT_7236154 [Phlegmacium glaucopus]
MLRRLSLNLSFVCFSLHFKTTILVGDDLNKPKMSSINGTSPLELPNPYTPLAFFPPDVAYQISVSIHTLVAALVVMIWDMLNNINSDYRLLTQYRIVFPTIAYFISRFATLGYLLASTIILTAPIGHCVEIWRGVPWLFVIAVPATSLLFFFRVRAVYNNNIYVTVFFFFMWLAVLGGSVTSTQGVTLIPLGPTDYCTNGNMEAYVIVSGIIPLVNDTLVFIAITWRIIHGSRYEHTGTGGMWSFIFGKHLPAFSRSILHDGQVYYLSTVGLCFLTVTLYTIKSVPAVYRSAVGIPNVMLINVMACRVYRNTKFGIFRETTVDMVLPTENPDSDISIVFRRGNNSTSVQSGGTPKELDVEKMVHTGVVSLVGVQTLRE